jgi:hypothetical protein
MAVGLQKIPLLITNEPPWEWKYFRCGMWAISRIDMMREQKAWVYNSQRAKIATDGGGPFKDALEAVCVF